LNRSLDDLICDGFVAKEELEANEESGTTVRVAKRVYVGNLSFDTNWQALKDHFRQAGKVVYCNTLLDPKSGRSIGSGIVEFETKQEAAGAIKKMHDTILHGRPLIVREDRDDRDLQSGDLSLTMTVRIGDRNSDIAVKAGTRNGARDSAEIRVGKRVYVGNLAFSTSWQKLKDHFKQVGKVVFANVMEEGGRSKGCGIVEFDSPSDAASAIKELHDSTLDGRLISVREDREDRQMTDSVLVTSGRRDASVTSRRRAGTKRKRRRDESSDYSSNDESESRGDGRHPGVRVARRVYVGNLSFETTWQELKDHFRRAGAVVYANVIGKSGSGIVEYERPEQARDAIEKLFDTKLKGRKLIVREDREDRDLMKGRTRGTVVARTTSLFPSEDHHNKRRRRSP